MKDKRLPNFNEMDAIEGKVCGKFNTVKSINPYKTYFIAHYPNGKVIKGNNLFNTGWDALPDGISLLQYKLSTGQVINIPKFKAYLSLIEVSDSIQGGRIFHSINLKGLGHDNEIINYKIILKQDNISKYKIGDILISKDERTINSPYWKMAAV
jgi:hypothetical protein